MRIITCYKLVPDEQDIKINSDQTLSFDRAQWKIGQYDLNAVETGRQLADEVGGTVSALSIGGKSLENSKLKKAILSRGPDDLFLVTEEALAEADTYQTAAVLAAAINKMGSFDLVLCGEGSSDLYAGQVGPQLGQLLGIPTLNAIDRISPDGDKLLVERTLEDEVEVLEVNLPAVLAVTSDINIPRVPGMNAILAAGKKPVTQWKLADLEADKDSICCSTQIISTIAPEQVERKQIILEGEEVVNELCSQLSRYCL